MDFIDFELDCDMNLNDDSNDILGLRAKYMQELDEELKCIYEICSDDIIYSEWKERFLEVVNDFYVQCKHTHNIRFLITYYRVYKENYYTLLCYYKYHHWTTSKIKYFGNGVLKINKDDNIKSVRNKMVLTINDELIPILNDRELKPLLLELKNIYVLECLYYATNIEDIKEKFRNNIILEIDKYNKRKEIISSLLECYKECPKFIIELYTNILDEERFNAIYKQNVGIKTKIKMKIKKKNR